MIPHPVNHRRYESYSHERLRDDVVNRNDPSGAGEQSAEWSELARELREVGDVLAALTDDSEAAWRGDAAEAVRSAVRAATEWSRRAAEVSDTVGSAIAEQAEAAARARADLPDPVSYDPAGMIREAAVGGDVWQLVGLSDAMSARAEEAERVRQKAVDVVYTRDSAFDTAVPRTEFPGPPSLSGAEDPGVTARGSTAPASVVGRSVAV